MSHYVLDTIAFPFKCFKAAVRAGDGRVVEVQDEQQDSSRSVFLFARRPRDSLCSVGH